MGEVINSSHDNKKNSSISAYVPFLVGMVVAMLLGWIVYPSIMYSSHEQPIAFNHKAHIEDAGMSCIDCHFFREDGTFNGRPTTESCAMCHASPMTDNPEEERFITEYVDTEREIKDEWLILAKQPDNVYFPHSAHSLENCGRCHKYVYPIRSEETLCKECHVDMSSSTVPPVYKENILSTYSSETMMMWECEDCHALPGHRFGQANASNACFVCHK